MNSGSIQKTCQTMWLYFIRVSDVGSFCLLRGARGACGACRLRSDVFFWTFFFLLERNSNKQLQQICFFLHIKLVLKTALWWPSVLFFLGGKIKNPRAFLALTGSREVSIRPEEVTNETILRMEM